jgi:hypothetical protein
MSGFYYQKCKFKKNMMGRDRFLGNSDCGFEIADWGLWISE